MWGGSVLGRGWEEGLGLRGVTDDAMGAMRGSVGTGGLLSDMGASAWLVCAGAGAGTDCC